MPDILTVLLALAAVRALAPAPDVKPENGTNFPGPDVGVIERRPVIQGGYIYDPVLDWDYVANERKLESMASVPMLTDGTLVFHEGKEYFWSEDRWYENVADPSFW